ncbi:tetratricopeptide repeat protein [Streptodolium elevatio]|uniref:Tetratricopeptide repeat protein n=1 Tax=Streptodolium elevatio TaxID=3157996 RepID=A0ABV3DGZ1_9ACTN
MTRSHGPDAPETLEAWGSLAWWTGAAGDAAGARDLAAVWSADTARACGPEDPEVLGARGEHAHWTGEAGDPATARDLLSILVEQHARLLQERATPADVLEPLRGPALYWRIKHAYWTGMAGDPAAARDLYAELLPDMARVHGPRHGNTVDAYIEAARWVGEAGDPAAARDLYAKLIEALTRWRDPVAHDLAEHHAWWATRARSD